MKTTQGRWWRRVVGWAACCALLWGVAGCPSPYTLGFPGEYPATRYFVEDIEGVSPIAVHHPAVPAPEGGWPVIVFNAGWNQPRVAYDGYGTQLAQWGYVCIVKFCRSDGLHTFGETRAAENVAENSRLLDWAATENVRMESPLYGQIDMTRVGVAGHSLGGVIAVGATVSDPRIKATVDLDGSFPTAQFDPSTAVAKTDVPILYVYAPEAKYLVDPRQPRFYDLTPAPTLEVTIHGADHLDLLDSITGPTYVAEIFSPGGGQDAQTVRDIATRYMVAWFNVYLKGETAFATYYDGAEAEADIAAGLVAIRSKIDK